MMTIQEVLGALCQGNVRGMPMTTSVVTLWVQVSTLSHMYLPRPPTEGQGKAEETDVGQERC